MTTASLRIAHPNDIPALAHTHLASWLFAYRGVIDDAWLDTLTEDIFTNYHRAAFPLQPGQPFLALSDEAGRIAGFARGGPTRTHSPTGDPLPADFAGNWSSELYAIYVNPDFMGQGHGRRLFAALAAELTNLGHTSMCQWVLPGNRSGRGFYDRIGGQIVAESEITLGGKAYPQVAYGWQDISKLPGVG